MNEDINTENQQLIIGKTIRQYK